MTKLSKLPLHFELNRGQAAPEAGYVARGSGYALLLTERGDQILALRGRSRRPALKRAERRSQTKPVPAPPAETVVLRVEFVGSLPSPNVQGEEPLPGHSNYLIGNDPTQWLTGVPHFARVRYRDVFPGVDVLYYTNDHRLEYDFIVHPGADPGIIRLTVKGALGLERSEQGTLVLRTAAGRLLLHKPFAYQEGPGGASEVTSEFVLEENGEIRFALGEYDRSRTLRIDPVLSYSAQVDASIQAIAVDSSGNSYLAGDTISTSFPTTPGVFQPTPGGNSDAVVAKLDATGSTLLFATYLGGALDDRAQGIAVDSSGTITVSGTTQSTNFPANNALQAVFAGSTDAFLSKLDPTGAQLLYSTYLGGTLDDSARGVALDASGHALLTGQTNSTNFPVSTGAFRTTRVGVNDAFVVKIDATQSGAASLLFSTYLGGTNEDVGTAIAVDAAGNALVTGWTLSANFPTASPVQAACGACPTGGNDAFVTKVNATGTALLYSTFLGGGNGSAGYGIAVDSMGSAYVAGETFSSSFPITAGAFQTLYNGSGDAFVSKLNDAGSTLVYSSFVGGSEFDSARGIAVDSSGNAYLTGYTHSGNFPTVSPLQGSNGVDCTYFYYYYYPFPYRCSDAVVPQMNAAGSALIYSTYLGGRGANDSGAGIAVDSSGNAYVAGTAGSSVFPFTQGALQPMSGGGFAAKISPMSLPGFAFDIRQVNFGTRTAGTTSPPVSVLLRNMGSAALNIASISTSGDFAQTNDCGASVAGGGNCALELTFSPTTVGPHNGMLIVTDNAAGSPHAIPLSGIGVQTSTTGVVSSVNPSTFGQPVTFTATVIPLGATGTVQFFNTTTATLLGSDLLDASGVASVTTNAVNGGTNSIVAQYLGDTSFGPSSSPPIMQVVNPTATTTALASSQNPSNQGQSVTFTATVTPSGATGQVSFRNGPNPIGSGNLNASGIATFSTSALLGGSHSITAVYAGDGNYASSTSVIVTQVVNSISLMISQSSVTVSRRGGTATVTLTVGQAGALTAPIGFSCSGLLAGWSCNFAPASVPAGSGPTPVILTLQVPSGGAQSLPPPAGNRDLPENAFAILALLVPCIALVISPRKASWRRVTTSLGLAVLLLSAAGCGGSGGPPPQVVNARIHATSGSTTTSTPLAITLQ